MTRYEIAPERSKVEIHARSSVHPIHSRTDGLEGYLELELRDGRVDLTVPPHAHLVLPVARLRSGNPLEERELKRRIDARRFPTIEGDLAEMQATDVEDRYLVRGAVTFRGERRTHEDELTIESVDDDTIRLVGTSTFDVRDFGMEPPRILLLRVEPEVKVTVEIVAVR